MRRTDWALLSAGVCLGLAAMAVDHLLGDDPGLEDPVTFLITAAIIVVIAVALFSLVVRRAHEPSRTSLIVAVLGVLSLPLIWLGVPFAVALAAIALGLRGEGRPAKAAVALGLLVLMLVTGAYTYAALDKLA